MNRHDSIFIAGLAVFSGLISFAFVFYAVGVLSAENISEGEKLFAYVAGGYGLGNVYIFSAAWRSGGTWTLWANKLIAFCFIGVYLMNNWRTGVENSLEYVGALAVAGVLWLNWFALKKVSERSNSEKDAPVEPLRGEGRSRKTGKAGGSRPRK